MKFTVEPGPFLRIVELVDERLPSRHRRDVVLDLAACNQRVWVKHGNRVAEIEAMVWENGQCRIARSRLLKALKKHRDEIDLLIEADKRGLRVGAISLAVSRYCPWVVLPASFQIFLGTNLDVVLWGGAQPTQA